METVLSVISLSATTSSTLVINQISSLSNNVFTLLNHITSISISNTTHQTEIIKILSKTDVEANIKLLHAIILEIPPSYNSSSIIIALENIKDIISKIDMELQSIHDKIAYNSNIYILSNIRSYDCKSNLDKIEILIAILDRRSNNLFNTVKFFNELN